MMTKFILLLCLLYSSFSYSESKTLCTSSLDLTLPKLYSDVQSVLLNEKIQLSNYPVVQSAYHDPNPRINYLIQLLKVVADNSERADDGGAISQKEIVEIVKRVQGYQFTSEQILKIIMVLDSPDLAVSKENLFYLKKSMYMILDLKKNMDKYESHGFTCKFLQALTDEELFDKKSPVLDEALTLKLDQESTKYLGRNQKKIFVASRCWGWW